MSTIETHCALLVYVLVYFAIAFGWRSYLVYRQTGRSPFVLPAGDDVEGYVGRAFRVAIVGCAVVVAVPVIAPAATAWLGPLDVVGPALRPAGWVVLIGAFCVLLVAQAQMGSSWRIGIDRGDRTALIRHGLFARSRNPIFLSMRLTLLGLFAVAPSAALLSLAIAGEILMQVQVRLEERHLAATHGEAYRTYCARVRRWL